MYLLKGRTLAVSVFAARMVTKLRIGLQGMKFINSTGEANKQKEITKQC